MLIKICGIQTAATAIGAAEAGADLIGFVFAESKRQVTVREAMELQNNIPKCIKTVGVFVNMPITTVNEIARQVDLDYIQLHGNEPVEDCLKSDFPIIKAISIQTKSDLNKVIHYAPVVDYLLLDGPEAGSGQTFDWDILKSIPFAREKLILSGGLSPENIQAAIKMVNPIGVDVSSGVETNGLKDRRKIKQFIKNVREAR